MLLDMPRDLTSTPRDAFVKVFTDFTDDIQATPDFELVTGFGIGIARIDKATGKTLDVTFTRGVFGVGESQRSATILQNVLDHKSGTGIYYPTFAQINLALDSFGSFKKDPKGSHPNIEALVYLRDNCAFPEAKFPALHDVGDAGHERQFRPVICFIGDPNDTLDSEAPAIDAWHRLHQLSYLKVKPNEINLEGIFGALERVYWTSVGPLSPAYVEENRLDLQSQGVTLYGVDKFARYIDYVSLPDRVRIADADRVRIGAYLSPETVVMHEGFVNFNAGTLGKSMVEGRISQGVVVGNGSDIGGGASIMGTLSGGGTHKVSIGERCLLGANAGIGISLGDDCVVEAGLYITAGTKIKKYGFAGSRHEPRREHGQLVKGSDLSGVDNLLFIRDSTTGAVLAFPRTDAPKVELNPALHA